MCFFSRSLLFLLIRLLLIPFCFVGVYLQRTCRAIGEVRQECDPPSSTIDFEKTIDFFCSQTCAHDGCNRHSVQDILSHGHRIIAMKKKNIVILIYSIIFLQMLFSLD